MEANIFENPLFNAAKRGLFEELKKICENHNEKEEKKREFYPALYIASYQGNVEIVKYLLSIGADPNYSFKNCLPPLHAAAQKGRILIGKLLLNYGAEINSKEKIQSETNEIKEMNYFSTPLLTASRGGHEYMVKFLLDNGANIEAKLSSISIKVSGMIEKLFTYGDYSETEINSHSEKISYTSLHLSVENGERRVVRTLIKYGANINSKSNLNITPLFVAIVKDVESIIHMLKKEGANLYDIVNGISIYQYLILRERKKNDLKIQKTQNNSNSEEEIEYSSCEL